jgi:hypothetical protein
MFLLQDYLLFYCWKVNRGFELSHNSRARENDHLHIYSPWRILPVPGLLMPFSNMFTTVTVPRSYWMCKGTVALPPKKKKIDKIKTSCYPCVADVTLRVFVTHILGSLFPPSRMTKWEHYVNNRGRIPGIRAFTLTQVCYIWILCYSLVGFFYHLGGRETLRATDARTACRVIVSVFLCPCLEYIPPLESLIRYLYFFFFLVNWCNKLLLSKLLALH